MDYLRLRRAFTCDPRITRCLVPAIVVVTLLFGLWPLNFCAKNQVYWLSDRNGVQFHPQDMSGKSRGWGAIYSAARMNIPTAVDTFQPVTVELYLEPHGQIRSGLNYILSFYDGDRVQPLIIAQWRSYLEIRSRDDGEGSTPEHRPMDLKDALLEDVRVLLTIVSRAEGTDVFLNGQLARSFPVAAFFGLEHFCGRLVLGNSPAGDCRWAGNLYGLALYGKSLSLEQVGQNYLYWTRTGETPIEPQSAPLALYEFDEREGTIVYNRVDEENHLTIPRAYKSLDPGVLRPFWCDIELNRELVADVIVNVFGFVPFGLCLSGCLRQARRGSYAWVFAGATVLGAFLSLAIEMAQVALPGRDSSSLDVICNTVGAGLGAVLFRGVSMSRKPGAWTRE